MTGEAGIGKTTLVRAFAAEAAGRARLLTSACDDLMAPRTLGPLRDAALGSAGPLADGLRTAGPSTACSARCSRSSRPTARCVLVVEDVHWADDATLDVLGYAARRIQPVGAVLVLTYRDDEIDAAHSLHRFLGDRGRRAAAPSSAATAVPPRRRAAVGGQRRRPGRAAPRHARQPVLRDRGAGLPARTRCRSASSRRCWRASGGSARTAATRSSSSRSSPPTSRASSPPRCSARAWNRSSRPSWPACSRSGRTRWRSATSWHGGRSSAACRRSAARRSTPPSSPRCWPSTGRSGRA